MLYCIFGIINILRAETHLGAMINYIMSFANYPRTNVLLFFPLGSKDLLYDVVHKVSMEKRARSHNDATCHFHHRTLNHPYHRVHNSVE